jgi:hypothetical protein
MERLFVIIMIVAAIWAGAEVYTKGVDGAFGGILASAFEAPANRSTPDRAADAFQRAYNKSGDRVDEMLERQDPQQ